jgi:hypothetical protein
VNILFYGNGRFFNLNFLRGSNQTAYASSASTPFAYAIMFSHLTGAALPDKGRSGFG